MSDALLRTVPDLPRRLRAASNPRGMQGLLRALGIPGTARAVPPALARPLVRLGARTLHRLEGPGPSAWLVTLARLLGPADLAALARAAAAPEAPALLLLAPPRSPQLVIACLTAGGELRHALLDRLAPRAADLQLLGELRCAHEEAALATALRWARALDRSTIGARFFRELRAQRDVTARAWRGLPARLRNEREQLSLLLLCRLLFLYFLQQRGHLLGDPAYLVKRLRAARAARSQTPLYARFIRPLFFGALNTRPERRDAAARGLGDLPYLNGGLFEPHALERRYPDLVLPDDVLFRVFDDFLERYRFATHEPADRAPSESADASLDPEVLGRAFEALMNPLKRGDTGTFYTPPAVVDRLVSTALAHHLAHAAGIDELAARRILGGEAVTPPGATRACIQQVLRDLRVLDPACGSGAFLLGALARITRCRASLEPDTGAQVLRADAIARTLHGVDLLDDAALLCSLRLWLALTPASGEPVTPLPNLDRRIRQGDALVDPLDLLLPARVRGADRGAALDGGVRRGLRALAELGSAYLGAEPEQRAALHDRLRSGEAALARHWLGALRSRLAAALHASRIAAGDRDLWGGQPQHAARAAREAERLERRLRETDQLLTQVDDSAALPFFSFLVHFAAERAGFDVVVSNPPWVRAHRWPAALAGAVRERYHVCRSAGWPGARSPAGQVDLALLFLERGLALLAEGGTLAMLLPAKLLRSLYAGGARELLLRDAAVLEIDDQGLDQRAVFRADAFTAGIVARKRAVPPPARAQVPMVVGAQVSSAPPEQVPVATREQATVTVTLSRRGVPPLHFRAVPAELPLVPGDLRSPWLLAPPEVAVPLRAMQRRGRRIVDQAGIAIRRGVITGANDVLVMVAHEHRLGGLARVHAQGWARLRSRGAVRAAAAFTAWVESDVLRPLLRGTDVRAWQWRTPQRILWVPANDRPGASPPPRLQRYLARHRAALAGRTGAVGRDDGTLLRLAPHTLGHKVAWQDIAPDLRAAAVPDRVTEAGTRVPVVPLNSVYFLAVASADDALLLAAYLNSLPLRVFARAIAERAKDAHFRFFAWTVGELPLPANWRRGRTAEALRALSREAHAGSGLPPERTAELDTLVADAYGLPRADLTALARFDAWLRGKDVP